MDSSRKTFSVMVIAYALWPTFTLFGVPGTDLTQTSITTAHEVSDPSLDLSCALYAMILT
jgi:hypothetical protein